MSDFKSMRDSSIKSRISKLSSNAGSKSGPTCHSADVVERTGPKAAAEFLCAEGSQSKPRSDRQPRKSGGRAMKKADGGKAKHDDEAEDRAMIKRMVKPDALAGKKDGGRAAYASGGAAKGKGSTTINIVMPAGGDDKPALPPMPPAPMPQAAPRPAPQPMPPGPGVSPTLNLNRGGRAAFASGGRAHFSAGAGSGEGRLEKAEHEKARG